MTVSNYRNTSVLRIARICKKVTALKKTTSRTFPIWLLLGLLSFNAHAVDEEFIYKIGGALPLSAGATKQPAREFGIGLDWNADLTCGNFDVATSVKNQLNGVSGYFDNLMNDVIQAATGYVASLPALVIQRLNPALYDLLQNGVLQGKAAFNFSQASCKTMVEKSSKILAKDGWAGLAKGQAWTTESNTGNADILQSEEKVNTEGLDKGVTWVGGDKAGGQAQQPIKIHQDTARAGFNLLLNRNATAVGPVATCNDAALCQTWNSPEELSTWVTEVLGDKSIQTCQGCDKLASTAGIGLQGKYEADQVQINEQLTELVDGTLPMTPANLNQNVTRRLIEAIREEEQPDVITKRLSGEMALSQTMERALLARRALLAGSKEPNVANNELAQTEIRHSLKELNDDIENMVFEMDVRSRMTSNTAASLLQRSRTRHQSSQAESASTLNLRDGAVQ